MRSRSHGSLSILLRDDNWKSESAHFRVMKPQTRLKLWQESGGTFAEWLKSSSRDSRDVAGALARDDSKRVSRAVPKPNPKFEPMLGEWGAAMPSRSMNS